MKTGVELIADERKRQVEVKGWELKKDLKHCGQELAFAAVVYATPVLQRDLGLWPWEQEDYKPTPDDRVRELIKAGALVAAEIDRLQSAKVAESKPDCFKPCNCGMYHFVHCNSGKGTADENMWFDDPECYECPWSWKRGAT